jgi:hypothetical protein
MLRLGGPFLCALVWADAGSRQLLSAGVSRDVWRFAAVHGWFILLVMTSL